MNSEVESEVMDSYLAGKASRANTYEQLGEIRRQQPAGNFTQDENKIVHPIALAQSELSPSIEIDYLNEEKEAVNKEAVLFSIPSHPSYLQIPFFHTISSPFRLLLKQYSLSL